MHAGQDFARIETNDHEDKSVAAFRPLLLEFIRRSAIHGAHREF